MRYSLVKRETAENENRLLHRKKETMVSCNTVEKGPVNCSDFSESGEKEYTPPPSQGGE
jgi:hypothetical protein